MINMAKKQQKVLNKSQIGICRMLYRNMIETVENSMYEDYDRKENIPYKFVIKKIEQLKEELDE